MINLRTEFLRVAISYIGIDSTVKNWLCDYYNDNCYQLVVDKSRKYKVKYTDNWCAMFASVCASKVGLKVFPYEVSVYQMELISKVNNRFYDDVNLLEVGDLITYNWNGDFVPDHVGIVLSVNTNEIIVIEGNYSNTVKIRTVKKDSKNISGFIKI